MTGNPISGPILELKNAHKAFGSKQVLRGVDLTVARGQSLVIIGGSGGFGGGRYSRGGGGFSGGGGSSGGGGASGSW